MKTDYEKNRLHRKLGTVLVLLVNVPINLSRLLHNLSSIELISKYTCHFICRSYKL